MPAQSNQPSQPDDDGTLVTNIALFLAVIGLAVGFIIKGKSFRLHTIFVWLAVVGLGWIFFYGNISAKKEEEAKQKYLRDHPLTAEQDAANKHFSTCWQYRHMPSSVWSDNQRNMKLISEGCYPDDRDDPRYHDATSPWNYYAPEPWKDAK